MADALEGAILTKLGTGPRSMAALVAELVVLPPPWQTIRPTEMDVREASWRLIDNGNVRLNWDTELELCPHPSGQERASES